MADEQVPRRQLKLGGRPALQRCWRKFLRLCSSIERCWILKPKGLISMKKMEEDCDGPWKAWTKHRVYMKHVQMVNVTNWRTPNGIGQLKCTTVPWFHGDQKISRHDCTWNYRLVLAPWILKAIGSPSVAFATLNSDSNSSHTAWDYESYELQKIQLAFPHLVLLFFGTNTIFPRTLDGCGYFSMSHGYHQHRFAFIIQPGSSGNLW